MTRFAPVAFSLSRTPAKDTNPANLAARANSFATTATDGQATTTILFHNSHEGIYNIVTLEASEDTATTAVMHLAAAVSSRADRAEIPESVLDAPVIVQAIRKPSTSRESMLNVDVAELGRRMENSVKPGSWVGISFREPTDKEQQRNAEWTDHRYRAAAMNHQSRQPGTCAISMWAGAESRSAARMLLRNLASSMQGFDTAVSERRVSVLTDVAPLLVAAVGSAITSGVLLLGGAQAISPSASLLALARQVGSFAGLLAIISTLVLLAKVTGISPTLTHRVRRGLPEGCLPAPAKRFRRPRPPREEDRDKNGKKVAAFEGDYPLHRSTFMCAPSIFVGLAAPSAETVIASATSRTRGVPPMVTPRIGPLIGTNGETPAHLSMSDFFTGVAIVGEAGSGKSGLTRSLFGWHCADWASPTQMPGSVGSRNTLIAFESKGDGVAAYTAWANLAQAHAVVIDVADPSQYAIDMFATPGNPLERAEAFVNGLKYAFDDGAIQDQAIVSLRSAFCAAIVLAENHALCAAIPGLHVGGSPVYYANVIVGNYGEGSQLAAANEILNRAKRPDTATPDIVIAANALLSLFDGVSPSRRAQLFQSSQNKIAQLMSLESWWARPRRTTWEQILSADAYGRHRIVVINSGDSASGHQVEEKLSEVISSLLLYTLQRAVKAHCMNWFETQRAITVFADELSMLTGSSPEVISWMKEKGRAYGLRLVFATQYPQQLHPAVRSSFLGFGTLIALKQGNREIANEVASSLSVTEGEIVGDEVMHLPVLPQVPQALIRTRVNGSPVPTYTVGIPHFEGDRDEALMRQGFAHVVHAAVNATINQAASGAIANAMPLAIAAPAAPVQTQPVPATPPGTIFTPPAAAAVDSSGVIAAGPAPVSLPQATSPAAATQPSPTAPAPAAARVPTDDLGSFRVGPTTPMPVQPPATPTRSQPQPHASTDAPGPDASPDVDLMDW